jgi:hypothetical protein
LVDELFFPLPEGKLRAKREGEAETPHAKPPEERYWSTVTRAMQQAGLSLVSGRGIRRKVSRA